MKMTDDKRQLVSPPIEQMEDIILPPLMVYRQTHKLCTTCMSSPTEEYNNDECPRCSTATEQTSKKNSTLSSTGSQEHGNRMEH